ncbi:hypothetical protein EYC84_000732 [Monilinia fructicola]|uniref:Uncharacterized protein n=1 Tax=Monilinia fructicola TaxID=38448 RepID=A0A5M9JK74_MONFR|nr:hypothetical protein EYC84_000732 [Monilinia fructicola]
MIKIDHSARAEDVSPPVPSLAILADQLLELEERQRARFSEEDGGLSRIKTGCLEIDNYVLCGGKNESDGGFERGVVVGLSAADGDESLGGRLISLNLIASVLLQHVDLVNAIRNPQSKSRITEKPKIMVIDATGSFSLLLLVKVLRSRILKMRQDLRNRNDSSGNPDSFNDSDEVEIQELVNTMLGKWIWIRSLKISMSAGQCSREALFSSCLAIVHQTYPMHPNKAFPKIHAPIFDTKTEYDVREYRI